MRLKRLLMSTISALNRQLASSFEMLNQAVQTATNEVWNYGTPPFWQVAFHIINSVDFYFSTFNPQIKEPQTDYSLPSGLTQHAGKSFFDKKTDELVSQAEIIEFITSTRDRIWNYFESDIETQLEDPSSFPWLPMNKFELILYNIRHIMEHVAIMNQYLKKVDLKAAGWVGIAEL